MEIEIVENTNILKVEKVLVKAPTVNDMIKAENIAGSSEGLGFMKALMAQIATFDGKSLVSEDMDRLSAEDFLSLSLKITTLLKGLEKVLSSLPDTQK